MIKIFEDITSISRKATSIKAHTQDVQAYLKQVGYSVVEVNDTKPWGSYLRIHDAQADQFIADFFDRLTSRKARLGGLSVKLSPKILIVAPEQRLSLQTHDRRAERWRFLTKGSYYKGTSMDDLELYEVEAGEVVQFGRGDIHRLCGNETGEEVVIVAEIWQHVDPNNPSDEDDIVRLEDDYTR